MTSGTLTINMLSDWHIGSGTGRPGSVDRLVRRDQTNLPYIPAKSLIGIWRDGCELVAQGLDNGSQQGIWQQWVNWIFGEQQPSQTQTRTLEQSPQMAHLQVRAAHFSETLRKAFHGQVFLQSMTTFVKPGVKINRHTGSALEDYLRFEEMARADAILEAEYRLAVDDLSEEQQDTVKAILVAGAAMVERLGAKRRRGAGRCNLSVAGLLELEAAIAILKSSHAKPPSLETPTDYSDNLSFSSQDTNAWWKVLLEVKTQSPVIIHRRTIGNHQETQDSIPGTYFLPLILRELQNSLGIAVGNALMHGDVVITNANPVVNQHRGHAVPFAIFEPKAKGGDRMIYQRLGQPIPMNPGNNQQLKGIRTGYVSVEEKQVHHFKSTHEINAHNTIADDKQRPDAEVGGLYTYAAIPAGSCFQLEVRLRDYLVPKQAVNPLAPLFQTEIHAQLGRTKKDDYGKISIQQIDSHKIAIATGEKTPEILTVWLLSDLLLRDDRLRPTTDLHIVAKRFSQTLTGSDTALHLLDLSSEHLPSIAAQIALARSSRTESWQTKWGLPRPSLAGLAAGTVLRFQVKGTIDPQKLKALEISGLGERTAEGYGQVCFNSELFTKQDLKLVDFKAQTSTNSDGGRIEPDTPEHGYAQLIERVAMREMIQRTAGAIAADPDQAEMIQHLAKTPHPKLSNSQLGTLRNLVDSLTSQDDAQRIKPILDRIRKKEKWQGKTIDTVYHLLADEEMVWAVYQSMGFDINNPNYRLTTESIDPLKRLLWADAIRILIDACIRAYRRSQEPANSAEGND